MRLFSTFASVVLLAAILQAQVPNYVPTDGLVGWWPFNGNANDESGNGNDGTVNGALITLDRLGNANSAYSFDGVDDYIDFGNISQLNGLSQVSFNLWAKVNTSIQYGRIISKEQGVNTDARGFNIKLSGPDDPVIGNGLIGGDIRTTSWLPSSWTTFTPSIQAWHMVTLVFNGDLPASDRVQYYIDGQETITTSFSVASVFPTTTASFIAGGTNFYFSGVIDDIGAWTRPLTFSEIQGLYNSGQPLSPCISPTPVSFSGLNSSHMTSDTPVMLTGTPAGGLFIGPGVSGSTFDPAVAGEGTHSISYTYLDDDNCVNTFSLCTSVSLGMGLEPGGGNQSGVRIFPNPSRGQFTVELDLSGLVSLQVFDARGALVHNEVFQANGAMTIRDLNLSGMTPGIYTVQVRNSQGRISQQVVID